MSFLRSFCLAILATLFLTYVLGVSFIELLDINIEMEGEMIEPLAAISVSALAMVVLVVAAIAIVLSVFGTFIFLGLVLLGSLALVALGAFWPVILIAAVIYFLAKDKEPRRLAQR